MSSEDLQLEDIVLLQLFKDQMMHNTLDQRKASAERLSAAQTDFSDLEKALSDIRPSFQAAHTKPAWPEHLQMGRLACSSDQFGPDGQIGGKSEVSHPKDFPAKATIRKGPTNKEGKSLRLGKDERLAKDAGIPFNVKQTLIGLPMDEFNDLLSKNDLSEEQLNICRDIRRRGKNKVAAQNCRQKKIEQIEELHGKLSQAMARRDRVRYEHQRLASVHAAEAEKLASLTDLVLKHHARDSQTNFTLQVVGDNVTVIPKTEVKEEESSSEEIDRYSNDSMGSYQHAYNNINPAYQENSQVYPRKLFNYYQNM